MSRASSSKEEAGMSIQREMRLENRHATKGINGESGGQLILVNNPVMKDIREVLERVSAFKNKAKRYYFEVILSTFQCPACGGQLHMTGNSKCSCLCGNVFDPTLAFQKSACCETGLVRKTFHYACSQCHQSVPSRFIFDEKVFDKGYFREMMRESRARKKKKREEIRQLLAESRSESFALTENPILESIPGLIEDLNEFIQNASEKSGKYSFDTDVPFDMDKYRKHILSMLSWDCMLFSDIEPIIEDDRKDRAWRFITLIFMAHAHEVEINQQDNDLSVQRRYNEAYA
jgi:hypothetical protein